VSLCPLSSALGINSWPKKGILEYDSWFEKQVFAVAFLAGIQRWARYVACENFQCWTIPPENHVPFLLRVCTSVICEVD
jgi:hypothetical protein